jgi:hypothetical protein
MLPYQAAGYRPSRVVMAGPRLGQGGMSPADWAWLAGGVIVGGVGINGLINQFTSGQPNAVAVLLDLALSAVGVSLFVSKLNLATAAAKTA